MSSSYDPSLFAGAARYYDKYRPKYPQAAFDYLRGRFKLDATCRVLDLGCGTGNASLPLAPVVGEIVAIDPDPDMIEVCRARASAANLGNVTWRNAGSRELSSQLGNFRLVTMGQSFHWMDRDQVLRDLYALVEDDGGIALIGPGHGLVLVGSGPPPPKESWEDTARAVLASHGVERGRNPSSNPSEPRHEQAIQRSQFEIGEYHEFESEISLSPDDVLGRLYSFSGDLRTRLGNRLDLFERDLRAALMALWPNGRFTERLRTGVLVAVKNGNQ
jgi:ubiquinone/menaquinone biosynthesis C-methylase UbiE